MWCAAVRRGIQTVGVGHAVWEADHAMSQAHRGHRKSPPKVDPRTILLSPGSAIRRVSTDLYITVLAAPYGSSAPAFA
eukprot:2757455-Rhodomonas_salina.2